MIPHSGGRFCAACNWRLYWGLIWLGLGAVYLCDRNWLAFAFAASPGLTFILWHTDHWKLRDLVRRDADVLASNADYIAMLERANAEALRRWEEDTTSNEVVR